MYYYFLFKRTMFFGGGSLFIFTELVAILWAFFGSGMVPICDLYPSIKELIALTAWECSLGFSRFERMFQNHRLNPT